VTFMAITKSQEIGSEHKETNCTDMTSILDFVHL